MSIVELRFDKKLYIGSPILPAVTVTYRLANVTCCDSYSITMQEEITKSLYKKTL